MRAVRDSEVAAGSVGLNSVVVRTAAFTLSAIVTGVAGAFFSPLTSFVSPGSFSFMQSILFLFAVIVGGAGTVLGPVLGAAVVVLLPEALSRVAEYRLLLFGALLLVVLWLAPDGIAGALAKLRGRRRAATPTGSDVDVRAFLAERAAGAWLAAAGLGVAFGGLRAVDGLDFTARGGQVTSIIGPNGAGKTTVLNLVCGFYRPDRGTVSLGDTVITGRPAHAVARAGIGRTYQTSQLFARLSVLDNLLIAMRRGRLGSLARALFGRRHDRDLRATAESLLAYVGYTGPREAAAGELSHVDKRLVEVARALATKPRVLMLDEPAAGLGHADTERVERLLRDIAATGVAVVLIEHDVKLVMNVSDHVVVLDAGKCIACSRPISVRPASSPARARPPGVPGPPACSTSVASRPAMAPPPCCAGSTSAWRRVSWWQCSAPTAPASRRSCGRCRACTARWRAPCCCWDRTSPRSPRTGGPASASCSCRRAARCFPS